ncbi:MAG TPA: alanine racemase [Acidimicrobiales bacterium]|jgi:uncharacterized pyridoxal phosphate-containing UPF0001 family protein|nr:alanine racemase [Acidimicrobiales bacterium]
MAPDVAGRLAEVRRRVGDAVVVVAVTKGFGPDAARQAVDAGIVDLGENYAQELTAKAAGVGGAHWHFLGHVQRNKVKGLAPLVHLWQGVDRPGVLPAGARALVQVNLSGLPGRIGCTWDDGPGLVERLRAEGVEVRGVMGVAGPGDPRPGFRRLAGLARDLGLAEVSMGMSGDYEAAVAEGATMVRLGTALFGPRPQRGDLRR